MCRIPIFFFKITFRRITLMWDDAQVSGRWAIDERKEGGGTTPRLPYHFSFYTNPDKKITFFKQYSAYFLVKYTGLRIHRDHCWSNVIILYIHRLFIGGPRSFSNKQRIHVFKCCYFLNGFIYELAKALCLWISAKEIIFKFYDHFFKRLWSILI